MYVDAAATPGTTFDGQAVTVTAEAFVTAPTPVAITRIDFGDGTSPIEASTGCHQLSPHHGHVTSARVVHRYNRPGQHHIRVQVAVGCGPHPTLRRTSTWVYTLPVAPPAAAGWPICRPSQLRLHPAGPLGATGHAQITVIARNTAGVACRLDGYPTVHLTGPAGRTLSVQVSHGPDSTFPGISPHLVALQPGGASSFLIGYSDNPTIDSSNGAAETCPAATTILVALPGSATAAIAVRERLSPCGGRLTLSPVLPGTAHLPFS